MLRICNRLTEHDERIWRKCDMASQQGLRRIERQLVAARNKLKRFLKVRPSYRTEFFLDRFMTVDHLARTAVHCAREERKVRRDILIKWRKRSYELT
jgi:hypothetical protein